MPILLPLILLAWTAWLKQAPAHAAERENLGEYCVQVGTFQSVRNALSTRSFLENLGPARVDAAEGDTPARRSYRVLVGRFRSATEAEEFIREYHLKEYFPKAFVNPVRIDQTDVRSPEPIALKDADKSEPYQLQVAFHCKDGKKKGEYQALLRPDPGLKGSDMKLHLTWECDPPPPVVTPEKKPDAPAPPVAEIKPEEEELNPSYLGATGLIGYNSLSATHDTLGSINRGGLTFGFQVGALKNFGAVSPFAEYRLLSRRQSESNQLFFSLEHRMQAGVSLRVLKILMVEPHFGFMTNSIVTAAADGTASTEAPLLPQAGLRTRFILLRPRGGTSVDLFGGYQFLFPTTVNSIEFQAGSLITAGLRTRHFFSNGLGADWFLEFNYRAQNATSVTQSETYFLGGISFLFSP